MKFQWKILSPTLPVAALLGLALMMPQAGAATLNPGASGVTPSSYSDPFALGNGTVQQTISGSFSGMLGTNTIGGDYTTSVISGYVDNPLGGLTFVYQYNLTTGSTSSGKPNDIQSTSHGAFDSFQTDVGFFSSGSGTAPATASRVNSDVVKFEYNPAIVRVGSSVFEIINTNAKYFNSQGSITFQDTASANSPAFQPVATPEPATMALAFSALPILGIGYLRRRNRRDA